MEIENLNVEHTIEFFKKIGYTWDEKVLDKGVHMNIEDLNIELAIEFLKTLGYTWDGKILDRDNDPTTINVFFCPRPVKLIDSNNLELICGITFYEDINDTPECELYKRYEPTIFVGVKNVTKEWTEFLKNKGFTF